MKYFLTEEDLKKQSVYKNNYWAILLPRRPIIPYHLIIVTLDKNKKLFTDLDNNELINLKQTIADIFDLISSESKGLCDGYNLFSNNGSYRIGQHINQFHQHIFLRFKSETESPYLIMNQGRYWKYIDSEEWFTQRNKLRILFD